MENSRIKEVAYWVNERERIREAHDAGLPRPWTNDKIFRKYRFCNVRREDDKVTRWVKKHWRDPYSGHPNMVMAMLLARMVNWPPTLHHIGFPKVWHPQRVIDAIHSMEGKAWSAAYIVSTCGESMDKAAYVVRTVNLLQGRAGYYPRTGDTLAAVWTRLCGIKGLAAGFIAAQVVADLKYDLQNPLSDASDWWTWAVPGPGSKRGLNRFCNRPTNAPWKLKEWQDCLAQMIDQVAPHVVGGGRIHAQDWQNTMCEYDKYMRVKLGEGVPRKGYAPETAYEV